MSDKPIIEVVTHVYCPRKSHWYAQMLKWQYASFYHHPPRDCRLTWTVCYTAADGETCVQLDKIQGHEKFSSRTRIKINQLVLDPAHLFRRSIGRNQAAMMTRADVVWFTDVDYLFGEHCLDDAVRQMDRHSSLCMPTKYFINFDHQASDKDDRPHHRLGQSALERELTTPLPRIDPSEFKEKQQRVCIGGMQIVGGDFARQNGYLRDFHKWQQPVDPALGFRSCRCDAAFRRLHNLRATKIEIRNLYRLRHLFDGRDYDIKGNYTGKGAW